MKRVLFLLAVGTLTLSAADTIVGSKHNLSASVNAASAEKQICKFCHTPHGAATGTAKQVQLWGHDTTVTPFAGVAVGAATSGSGSTFACLSCHDGSVAINANTAVLTSDPRETKLGDLTTNSQWTATAGQGFLINTIKTDVGSNHPVNMAYPLGASYMQDPKTQWVSYTPMPILFDGTTGEKIRTPSTWTGSAAYVQCSTCHAVHGSTQAYTTGDTGKFMLNMTMNASALCLKCHRK